MSHLLRRPLFQATHFQSSLATRRCFSNSKPLLALPTASSNQAPRARSKAEKSLRLQAQQAHILPSDLGILPKTFITPTGHNLPSLFRDPRSLLRLQVQRFRTHSWDFVTLILLKFASPKTTSFFRRKFLIKRAATKPAALAMHKQMYQAFASGDVMALRKLCCDGIYDSFAARIANRPRGEKVEWELVKYNKRPKVVSHRAAKMPIEGSGVRQAVVRIASRQKLTRWRRSKGGEFELVPGSGVEKDVVEYLVVQRIMRDTEEGDWMVWGTTEETTLDDVKMWEREALE